MSRVLLLCFMFAWPALAQEAVHTPPEPASPQSPRESASQAEREPRSGLQATSQANLADASKHGRRRTLEGTSSATRQKSSVNGQPHSTPGTEVAYSLAPSRFAGTATSRSIQNTDLGGTRPVPPPKNIATIRPSPATARHRGANPATVGGATNSSRGNAGALSGSLMTRKP